MKPRPVMVLLQRLALDAKHDTGNAVDPTERLVGIGAIAYPDHNRAIAAHTIGRARVVVARQEAEAGHGAVDPTERLVVGLEVVGAVSSGDVAVIATTPARSCDRP